MSFVSSASRLRNARMKELRSSIISFVPSKQMCCLIFSILAVVESYAFLFASVVMVDNAFGDVLDACVILNCVLQIGFGDLFRPHCMIDSFHFPCSTPIMHQHSNMHNFVIIDSSLTDCLNDRQPTAGCDSNRILWTEFEYRQ